jgi:hypothetical protein
MRPRSLIWNNCHSRMRLLPLQEQLSFCLANLTMMMMKMLLKDTKNASEHSNLSVLNWAALLNGAFLTTLPPLRRRTFGYELTFAGTDWDNLSNNTLRYVTKVIET